MTKRRVVVTGIGAISPIGSNIDKINENLQNGYCGIDKITYFDTTDRKVKLAAEVKDIDLKDFFSAKELKRMDKVSAYALYASKKALEDSNLGDEIKENERVGVYISSGIGGIKTIETETEKGLKKGFDHISPFFIPMSISNMSSAIVSINLGINGPTNCPVTACAGGTNAIGEAFRNIRDNYTDICFAGGTESSITPLSIGGFTSIQALSTNDDKLRASIPFDKDRNGFVMGEGSAILILEELEHAKKRGAKIYAEIVGYGFTSDASHITAPNKEGIWAAKAMQNAINDAGITYDKVNMINAHATSTPLNDSSETKAIKLTFKEHTKNIYVSGTKSMTGHLLAAAGAIEALICILGIKNNYIAPTINFKNEDPECDLNIVKNKAIKNIEINYAMSNSLGFGGHNCVILFKKFK